MSYYMLEIGTEELPASFINPAAESLKEHFHNLLVNKRISFGNIRSGGTPRRLYLYIDNLSNKQEDREEELVGPPAQIAFDKNGELTKAGEGFAKSKGLSPDSLRIVKTEKGEYAVGTLFHKGEETSTFLQKNVPLIISSIPFQKSMRWGDKDIKFARPIHWFVSVFNGDVLFFEMDGIKASNITYGHRFMGNNPCTVTDILSYETCLENNNVVLSFEKRKEIIRQQIEEIERDNNLKVEIDDELLGSVANLVEKPYAILGTFAKDFLELPKEVLVTSMKNHQKYFYTTDVEGELSNHFVGVSNTEPKDETIKFGYEKVLKARLADAVFFFENDKKVLLEQKVEELKDVIYQQQLGTSYEKMERFYKIASYLAGLLAPDHLHNTQRVAYLCKGDLMSEMVYEFPELQGVMGREYAKAQGENEAVCTGIYEHYLPRFAGDTLPTTTEGSLVSIADKIDTICGCFAIGLIPTGNNDPYALRRNAIGILNIIRKNKYRLDLKRLIEYALEVLSEKINVDINKTKEEVFEFVLFRFKKILSDEGVSADIFDAAKKYNDIISFEMAAKALSDVKDSEDFTVISTSYKRINNILKKSEWHDYQYDPELFQTPYEQKLDEMINTDGSQIAFLVNNEEYRKAIEVLLKFRIPVDEFFDNVMVMDKDENIKNNRLSLLCSLKNVFDIVGDLSQIN